MGGYLPARDLVVRAFAS